jgi:hypothetical protein
MIEGIDEAAREIRRQADDALDWLTPEGEKNLLGAEFVAGFAAALVMAFLAGFQEEAVKGSKKIGKQVGKASFRWLGSWLSNLGRGAAQKPPADVESLATAAPKEAAALGDQEFEKLADQTQEELVQVLKDKKLPADRAARVGKAVRNAAKQHVLKRGKKA